MVYNEHSNSLVLWKGFHKRDRNLAIISVRRHRQVPHVADDTEVRNEIIGGLSEAKPRGARRQFVKSIAWCNTDVSDGGPGVRYKLCGRRTQ
jgi:hypothetical protein